MRHDDVMSADATCAMCGRARDEHNRHVRFMLPDAVLASADRENTAGTWLSDADARTSVMMQVPGIGTFVRALLPVALEGDASVTFGVWLAIHPDELQRVFRVWWEPEYADLVVDGWLANALPVWGLLAAPVRAVVRNPDETPYCDTSSDEQLAAVLTREWPHELVLGAIDL